MFILSCVLRLNHIQKLKTYALSLQTKLYYRHVNYSNIFSHKITPIKSTNQENDQQLSLFTLIFR